MVGRIPVQVHERRAGTEVCAFRRSSLDPTELRHPETAHRCTGRSRARTHRCGTRSHEDPRRGGIHETGVSRATFAIAACSLARTCAKQSLPGRADYTPIFLSEIESLFETGALPLDVVLMQVTPPDAHGFVSLSTTVDCTMTAARCAKTVIAEVNDRAPRTHGDTSIHVSQISAFVQTSRPLLEIHTEPFTEMHMKVARNVASLIPDGATLQPGIGGISDAVLSCLRRQA